MKREYTVGETAARLGMSLDKLRQLADNGVITCTRTDGRHRRFAESAIQAYERRARASRSKQGREKPRSTNATKRKAPKVAPPSTHLGVSIFDNPDYEDDPIPIEGLDDEASLDEVAHEAYEPVPKVEVPARRQDRPLRTPQQLIPSEPDSGAGLRPEMSTPDVKLAERARDEAERLQALKHRGMTDIPYDIPPAWRAKIVADLEQRVVSTGIPQWVPDNEQRQLVGGIVDEWVQAYRTEQEVQNERKRKEEERRRVEQEQRRAEEQRRAAAERAKEESRRAAERQKDSLVWHGKMYLSRELREFSARDRWDLRRNIEAALEEGVKADWDEEDVEELVDDELGQFADCGEDY